MLWKLSVTLALSVIAEVLLGQSLSPIERVAIVSSLVGVNVGYILEVVKFLQRKSGDDDKGGAE